MANDAEKSVPSGTAPRTPLLLHACCGPCSLEPVKYLRLEGFEPTVCWTNPNIAPVEGRCRACYALRLAESCRVARERGFTHVSTTLAVSPYQLFDACGDVLATLARAHGLTSVWRDFRPHYPESVTDSRELGMYRQNYCGCRFSAAEAALERQAMRDWRKAAKAARREGRELPPRPDFFPG